MTFNIVALAASAGGLNALSEVLSGLPENFPASVVVVQHLAPKHRSMMADILNRRTALMVKQAENGELLQPGVVYIAPPDHHLLINENYTLSLTQSELVNFVRPAADLLFNSVAHCYQERAIAVVLSGTGHDGAKGAETIAKMGGIVIAQDDAAEQVGMPKAAIKTGIVNYILPLKKIPSLLTFLTTEKIDD
jgi:two-component system, chemotaxis family, protein-glutamate methylesterase/glutaminase